MSISEQETNEGFFAEFLDDFFAESEEHLTALRRDLLALERFVNKEPIDRDLLEELFRSFHSLKGISGMVGVREAERLAHEMESYLRILRQGEARLTEEGLEGLISGTKMLEQVISARREQQPMPDIAAVISELQSIISQYEQNDNSNSPIATADPIASVGHKPTEAIEHDAAKVWRFEFIPTPQLAERGVNVNSIRARLQEAGELRSSSPRVLAGGGIAFEFIVSSRADESSFASLGEEGVTFELFDEPVPVPETLPNPDKPESASHKGSQVFAPSNVVRVNLSRLDDLMRMVGDLVISRARLEDTLKDAETEIPAPRWRALFETNQVMGRQLRDLREGVMRVRMVPVGEIFERMRFVVRDLSREYQKGVRLELRGQETEIDKLLIERMMDPLLHLVRNAISHGLESPGERQQLGKPLEGNIVLRAYTSAEMVMIEVEDDGRGIDRNRVAERAKGMGLIGENTSLDDRALLDLICSPGFSTREEADRASGRGVGMAVVQRSVLGLGGALTLDSQEGRGTRFTIQLPITLAIADALIVSAGGQRFAVPQSSASEVIEIDSASVKAFENNEVITHRGGVLPIIRLSRLFGLDKEYDRAFHAFVVGKGLNAVAIAVDRILGQREIVVRAINDPLIQIPGFAGATELGDGRVVLILDAAALTRIRPAAAMMRPLNRTSGIVETGLP